MTRESVTNKISGVAKEFFIGAKVKIFRQKIVTTRACGNERILFCLCISVTLKKFKCFVPQLHLYTWRTKERKQISFLFNIFIYIIS